MAQEKYAELFAQGKTSTTSFYFDRVERAAPRSRLSRYFFRTLFGLLVIGLTGIPTWLWMAMGERSVGWVGFTKYDYPSLSPFGLYVLTQLGWVFVAGYLLYLFFQKMRELKLQMAKELELQQSK